MRNVKKIILVRAFLLTSFSLKKETATNFVGVALEGLSSSAKYLSRQIIRTCVGVDRKFVKRRNRFC